MPSPHPVICCTGHRPDKLFHSDPYSEENFRKLTGFAAVHLALLQPDRLITGMALGWDQACAAAAKSLNIPYLAVIPHAAQPSMWPTAAIVRWSYLKDSAESVWFVSKNYSLSCLQDRNEYMVDRAALILALHSGAKGGTANCIAYANRKRVPVINLWDQFEEQV